MNYLFLFLAIASEVVATSFMKASEGFTKLYPSIIGIVGFSLALYFLSLAIRTIPLGVAYALWSAIGIVATILIGWLVYHQKPDIQAIIGISFIIIGVLIVNLLSKMSAH